MPQPRSTLLAAVALLFLSHPAAAQRHQVSVTSVDGLPLILAEGDTLAAKATRYVCPDNGHDCLARDPRDVTARWKSDDPTIALVTRTGRVIGIRPGRTTVRAVAGTLSATATIEVTPKATSFRWQYSPAKPQIGDTLRAAMLLINAAGAVVGTIPPVVHIRGTGMTGDIISFDSNREAWLTVSGPGDIVLVGYLGKRSDTLRLAVPASTPGRPK